jgi:hypothetical protein
MVAQEFFHTYLDTHHWSVDTSFKYFGDIFCVLVFSRWSIMSAIFSLILILIYHRLFCTLFDC